MNFHNSLIIASCQAFEYGVEFCVLTWLLLTYLLNIYLLAYSLCTCTNLVFEVISSFYGKSCCYIFWCFKLLVNFDGSDPVMCLLQDLGLAQNSATATQSPNPMGSLAHQIYRMLCNAGYARKDFASVFLFLQEELKKKWTHEISIIWKVRWPI